LADSLKLTETQVLILINIFSKIIFKDKNLVSKQTNKMVGKII